MTKPIGYYASTPDDTRIFQELEPILAMIPVDDLAEALGRLVLHQGHRMSINHYTDALSLQGHIALVRWVCDRIQSCYPQPLRSPATAESITLENSGLTVDLPVGFPTALMDEGV